jgi:hypothetical protein
MNAYRLKEILWAVIIVIFILMALLGCSSAPKQTARQYCHTSQEIRKNGDNTVSSDTLVKCNDDPIEQMTVKKMGIAQNCGEYRYFIPLNGRTQERRGYACQKFDGTWEIVPHPTSFR